MKVRTMKSQSLFSVSAIALMLGAMAAPAQAVLSVGGSGAVCLVTDTTINASKCSGSWANNNKNQDADVYAELFSLTGIGGWSEIKDVSYTGGSSGSLAISPAVIGPFAIALKASNSFSLYYYSASVTSVSSLSFITNGVSVNKKGIAQGLSHATLYQTAAVPEPETYALMLAGLGVMGFVAKRQRRA